MKSDIPFAKRLQTEPAHIAISVIPALQKFTENRPKLLMCKGFIAIKLILCATGARQPIQSIDFISWSINGSVDVTPGMTRGTFDCY
ncbi:hypothetical protein [Hydrogenophaga palleronii]|uniref:hypothetical protein n=1 Tax=Hydrogenophaga palleronii TaxID=65655 RepID=UPI0012EE3EFA|nr:hypothetical protein [Hydrogenophaga palleronii]